MLGRVQPVLAWKQPGLPREWTRVLERMRQRSAPSRCLGTCGWRSRPQNKRFHAWAAHLEFRDDRTASA
jgi:hypothetical protein